MILVTGATGLLGNNVVRELLVRGKQVRVLCRASSNTQSLDGLDVDIAVGELTNPQAVTQALTGCHCVIHCAALIHIGWHKLAASRLANVEGTRTLAQICAQRGIRFLHISTVDTLPAALSVSSPVTENSGGRVKTQCSYVVSKSESEKVVIDLAKSENLDAIILHPGFMLGPYDWKPSSGRMLLEVSRAPLAAAPAGGCSVCDVRDVATAVANAIEKRSATPLTPEHYILAGYNLSYRQFWQHILEVAGSKKRAFRIGPMVHWIGYALDLLYRLTPIAERDVNGAAIQMGSLLHYYDSSKAQRELAYQNRDLDKTLCDAWQWLQKFR